MVFFLSIAQYSNQQNHNLLKRLQYKSKRFLNSCVRGKYNIVFARILYVCITFLATCNAWAFWVHASFCIPSRVTRIGYALNIMVLKNMKLKASDIYIYITVFCNNNNLFPRSIKQKKEKYLEFMSAYISIV